MGLASIPFLVSIWTACVSILKSLWDAAKSRMLIVGIFLRDLIRFVVGLIKKYVTYKYVLWAALSLLIGFAIQSVLSMIDYVFDIRDGWQYLLNQMPGVSWLLWDEDGIVRLSLFFQGVSRTLLMYASCCAARTTLHVLKFNVYVAINGKMGSGQ